VRGSQANSLSVQEKRVLLVEDDGLIRGLLADLLGDAGYAVHQAVDGSQALTLLQSEQPHLVVLDLMLPKISGWQFLERARASLDRANVPVVIVSAIAGMSDYPRALGAAAWFTKPIDLPRFMQAVEQHAGAPPPTV
jgi:CheY-like chemotaxis protein